MNRRSGSLQALTLLLITLLPISVLFTTQRGMFDYAIGVVAAVTTAVPVVVRLLGMFKGERSDSSDRK